MEVLLNRNRVRLRSHGCVIRSEAGGFAVVADMNFRIYSQLTESASQTPVEKDRGKFEATLRLQMLN